MAQGVTKRAMALVVFATNYALGADIDIVANKVNLVTLRTVVGDHRRLAVYATTVCYKPHMDSTLPVVLDTGHVLSALVLGGIHPVPGYLVQRTINHSRSRALGLLGLFGQVGQWSGLTMNVANAIAEKQRLTQPWVPLALTVGGAVAGFIGTVYDTRRTQANESVASTPWLTNNQLLNLDPGRCYQGMVLSGYSRGVPDIVTLHLP